MANTTNATSPSVASTPSSPSPASSPTLLTPVLTNSSTPSPSSRVAPWPDYIPYIILAVRLSSLLSV